MTACTQPGCTGTIVDGYCDVCGSPGTEGAGSHALRQAQGTSGSQADRQAQGTAGSQALRQAQGTADSQALRQAQGTPGAGSKAGPGSSGKCTEPGCTGTIVDGYCDVCGSPGSDALQQGQGTSEADSPLDGGVSAATRPSMPAGAASTITRASSRLSSTALGSQRLTTSGSKITRRVHSGSQRLRSARLGAGLTRVPPAPTVEPLQAIMKNPMVPESKRVCPSCGAAVGRSRDGAPGRTEGFCPRCRNPFSFTPKLKPGDLVANQYEVAGCLAHGGLGWIYLAKDRNVSDRWVVLKGLLNTGDADALAVAIVERQFLAQVEHPLIVEIYNFVSHDSGDGVAAGYIVMEYVGGTSLKQILKERMRTAGGAYDALPVDQALAYVLEVLPAFTYLHDLGLVYCDFKPDNLIQIGDAVKLIDMGGVRRIDDEESAIYGTVGYQAPEVAQVGTTVASDIYTIGRTLVVLMMEFRGYQTKYVASLPPVEDTPLFQQHDSLYRLLAKACAPDPADRFATVDEMRVQLLGVLREVVAENTTGTSLTSAASMLFEAPAISSAVLTPDELPRLRTDTTDAQFAWLSNITAESPELRLAALSSAPAVSVEVQLARARAMLELDRPQLVDTVVNEMLAADPWEWRAVWMSGLSLLAREDFRGAQSAFNAVYGQVPGELGPKLALALACERGGEAALAERLYATCARTDANYVAPAAFGLARLRIARNDVHGGVEALDLVPPTSRAYPEARRLRAVHLYESDSSLPVLAEAMNSITGVRLDPTEHAELTARILERALDTVTSKGPQSAIRIGTYTADNNALRDGLEQTYRNLAQSSDDEAERYRLVDEANRVRRWTLT